MRARLELLLIGFSLNFQVTHSFLPSVFHIVEVPSLVVLKSGCNSAEDEFERDEVKCSPDAFLEEASLKGAEIVKALSIEERTKRAMLAEAVEDQMALLEDELDELLGEDGMPLEVEFRDKIEALARQIKGLREQYQLLVSGGGCPTVDPFDTQNKSDDQFDIFQ